MTKGNLPKELIDKKVDVLCNECLHKSYQVPFHFFGIKCEGCGTYNTKLIWINCQQFNYRFKYCKKPMKNL